MKFQDWMDDFACDKVGVSSEESLVGEKIRNTKKSSSKKQGKAVKILKSPITIAVAVLLLAAGGYFIYKTIHYYSAPAEIKAIRKLPIYNYESDNLKIVSRSEDYGGTDWKHVYNSPNVYISFDNKYFGRSYEACTRDLTDYLITHAWEKEESFLTLDKRNKAHRFQKTVQGKKISLVIWPGELKDELCYVSVKSN